MINNVNTRAGMSSTNEIQQQGKLAAAMNMNNIQAQLINQYKLQLASLQTQIANTPRETQFEIYVSKDTFKFNASHFVAYPGFRERLHGHNYRASVKLIGSHQIGRDGYVLDFGCVKSAAKDVCKQLNEYFLVPTLSDVLKIVVGKDVGEDCGKDGQSICGECEPERKKKRRRKGEKYPGSVSITCEDGSTFVFPKQDCILLPIMHSTAEELAIYIYGKIMGRLDAQSLLKRGVKTMEVTVSEAVGQDAVFRNAIPSSGSSNFDVASYISSEPLLVAPCATETEVAKMRQSKS